MRKTNETHEIKALVPANGQYEAVYNEHGTDGYWAVPIDFIAVVTPVDFEIEVDEKTGEETTIDSETFTDEIVGVRLFEGEFEYCHEAEGFIGIVHTGQKTLNDVTIRRYYGEHKDVRPPFDPQWLDRELDKEDEDDEQG
ncbi:hypothetical protein EBZ39_00395 [bacterium]|nr:hypothetical protein [bacterium]